MRDSSGVPGARGERARQEAAGVVGEVRDNHFNCLLGKPRGRGGACDGRVRRGTPKKSFSGPGEASAPDTLSNRCNGKQRDATIRQGIKWQIVGVPDSRDAGVFVSIVLLFQGVEGKARLPWEIPPPDSAPNRTPSLSDTEGERAAPEGGPCVHNFWALLRTTAVLYK
jgi:hypothetical protein